MSLTQPPFDPSRAFVCATFFRAAGHAWERGAPFDKSLIPVSTLKLLYDNRKITYADASANEEAAALAPATLEEVGGGWYAVGAPWMDEPEKVQGRDKAVLMAQQIRDAGEPTEHHGVAVVEGENGWYAVNALWMPEPEKVHGEEAARARAAELREEGPPDGWQYVEPLIGSDTFEAEYTFGDQTVPLADILEAALAASGHDRAVWNKLDAETRDGLVKAEIERREADAEKGGGEDAGDALKAGDVVLVDLEGNRLHGKKGTIETIEGDTATVHHFEGEELQTEFIPLANLSITEPDAAGGAPSIDDRIAALVDGNTEQQLRDKIATIDEARAAADPPLEPLGAKSSDTKADLAKLIVEANGDLEAGGGDGGTA
jgi:hypothetical protein